MRLDDTSIEGEGTITCLRRRVAVVGGDAGGTGPLSTHDEIDSSVWLAQRHDNNVKPAKPEPSDNLAAIKATLLTNLI